MGGKRSGPGGVTEPGVAHVERVRVREAGADVDLLDDLLSLETGDDQLVGARGDDLRRHLVGAAAIELDLREDEHVPADHVRVVERGREGVLVPDGETRELDPDARTENGRVSVGILQHRESREGSHERGRPGGVVDREVRGRVRPLRDHPVDDSGRTRDAERRVLEHRVGGHVHDPVRARERDVRRVRLVVGRVLDVAGVHRTVVVGEPAAVVVPDGSPVLGRTGVDAVAGVVAVDGLVERVAVLVDRRDRGPGVTGVAGRTGQIRVGVAVRVRIGIRVRVGVGVAVRVGVAGGSGVRLPVPDEPLSRGEASGEGGGEDDRAHGCLRGSFAVDSGDDLRRF